MFLQLKLLDSNKIVRSSGQPFWQHKESTLASTLAALRRPWMASLIGEALILNGSGSVDVAQVGCRQPSEDCIVQPDADAWTAYRIRSCAAQKAVDSSRNRFIVDGTSPSPDSSRAKLRGTNQTLMLHHQRRNISAVANRSAGSGKMGGDCCAPRNVWLADGNNEVERVVKIEN